jgi:hypothetical protein
MVLYEMIDRLYNYIQPAGRLTIIVLQKRGLFKYRYSEV